MKDSTSLNTSVQVISRMFAVLEALERERRGLSLKVVSEKTGLHPSTAHRILNDLALGKFVERSGPGHYRLGIRLLELGNAVRASLNVRELATTPMLALHRATGCTSCLFVIQNGQAACVESTEPDRQNLQRVTGDGLRMALTTSAPGRVLLRSTLESVRDGLQSAEMAAIQQGIEPIGKDDIACQMDALGPDLHLAAAPVFDDSGCVIASLAIVWQGDSLIGECKTALKEAARQVSRSLGCSA